MASEGVQDETCIEQINIVMLSIIKEFPILLNKSQLPGSKDKKAKAVQQAKHKITTALGKNLEEKQILKKISNMKVQVKKKTDGNQTGNRKIVLSKWEQELFDILQGDENPTITKMSSSISAGFQRSSEIPMTTTLTSSCSTKDDQSTSMPVHSMTSQAWSEETTTSSQSTRPIPRQSNKRKTLSAETDETIALSTPELQRLVLLEQLRYLRAKLSRLDEEKQRLDGEKQRTIPDPPDTCESSNYTMFQYPWQGQWD